MSFNLKTYKLLKIKNYFKKINFLFFFQGTSLNKTNRIKTEQLFNKEKLKYFQILNSLTIKVMKNSILKNLTPLIHGSILLVHTNRKKLTLKKLSNISILINLLCLRLNNKIYSKNQIKNLKKLSYIENIYRFYNSMQMNLKMLYYIFNSKKTL